MTRETTDISTIRDVPFPVLDTPATRFGLGVAAALMASFIGWGGERTGARAPEHNGTAAINWRDQKPHGRTKEAARRRRQMAQRR